MTENKLKLVGAFIGAALLVGICLGFYCLVTSCSPEGVPKEEIMEYYDNDDNYRTVIGQIVVYIDQDYLYDKMVISTGDVEYLCQLPAKSVDILRVNEFDFSAGGVYKFTICNPYDLSYGYMVAAVKSVMDSREYLSYDIGKNNLIKLYSNVTE